jgi:hypothetical protein
VERESKEVDVQFSETEITPHQMAVARRIEDVLVRTAEYRRCERASEGNGPSVEFDIRTRHPGLMVRIIVYQDSVQLLANDAVDMIEMLDSKYYERWSEAAASATAALFEAPLRIRIRHTMFARNRTGSIYLQYGGRGGWSGDGLSSLGIGKTFTFSDWYYPAKL